MPITQLPQPPSRDRLESFDAEGDAFLGALPQLVTEINATTANISAQAAPGGIAIPYTFNSNTTDIDPGDGRLALNSATQNQATAIRFDLVSSAGDSWASIIDSFDSATSTNKGQLRIAKVGDSTKWVVFNVTGRTAPSGYRNITGTVLGASGAAPFANGDALIAFFTRTGDRGGDGSAPTNAQIMAALGILDVEHGGTGADDAVDARANLGAAAAASPVFSGPVTLNSTGATLSITPSSTSGANGTTYNTSFAQGGSGPHVFKVGGVPAMNIYSNVIEISGYISTTSTGNAGTSRLVFIGRAKDATQRFGLGIDTDESIVFWTWNATGTYTGAIHYRDGGIEATGAISGSTFSATSSETLKEDWRDLPADFVEQLAATRRAGLFRWKASGVEDGGVGAQSIRAYAPWAVTEINGVLHVNHGGYASASVVELARRLVRLEAALRQAGIAV